RWTRSEVGGLNTSGFVAPKLIHYPTFDKFSATARRIPAFLYLPEGPGPFPVVVKIHGGPESQYRPWFSSQIQYWVNELEIAVLAPNVRGSSGYGKSYLTLDNGFKREDSVKDIGALLNWIFGRPELDASRVGVYGGSYGGYMVLAALARYPDKLRAGVDVVGISNFVTFLKNTKAYRRDLRRAEYGDERNEDMRVFLEKISPTNLTGSIKSPLFVVQGANDPRVPASEAAQIVSAVKSGGNPVWYLLAEDEGHGFRKKKNKDYYRSAVSLFWEKHLLE
ncbi:MAG: alpha/beta fold hydrolase, partial [Elusimicrobiota bacterium]